MKGLIISLLFVSLFQCSRQSDEYRSDDCLKSKACTTIATVIDMTGLDGCGLMFELEDGTRLDPIRREYIQAPSIEEDPLYHFELKAGQHVKISWVESLGMNICMAGPLVYITCISECGELTE